MTFPVFDPIYRAAMSLLPAQMDCQEAYAMLYAIGMQESRFEHRAQIGGPARGFWQFERGGGVKGVLQHGATEKPIQAALTALRYDDFMPECSYRAIEHNDLLACCFARLLLYTLPESLPRREEAEKGWELYLDAWRPGKPHPHTWEPFFRAGWEMVDRRV